eukprot:scaffold473068_cov67-Attheya_sp.AAC.1
MRQGIEYQETYAHAASRNLIQLLLMLTAVHGWHSTPQELDYVLTYSHPSASRKGALHEKSQRI